MITNDGTFNENVYTKAVRTLATLKEAREKGNKRSERTAERALNALAVDYPVEVKKAGWDLSKPHMINRVLDFFCLHRPMVFNAAAADDPPPPVRLPTPRDDEHYIQCRLAHEYQNHAIKALFNTRQQILGLARKDELAYRAAHAEADAKDEEIRKYVNKWRTEKQKGDVKVSDGYVKLKAEKSQLTTKLNALRPLAFAERRTDGCLRGDVARLKQLKIKKDEITGKYRDNYQNVAAALFRSFSLKAVRSNYSSKSERFYKGKRISLYQGNYIRTEEGINTSMLNWIKDINNFAINFAPKYGNRKTGEFPADMMEYPAYDRCGAVSIQTSNSLADQPIATAFNGSNSRVRIAPMEASDTRHFPGLAVATQENTKFFRGAPTFGAHTDNRRKIDFERIKPQREGETWYRRGDARRLHMVKVRIQSEGPGNRIPKFDIVPVLIHREIPKDAIITSATIRTYKDSGEERHKFLLGIKCLPKPVAGAKGEVTLNLIMDAENDQFGTFTTTELETFTAWLKAQRETYRAKEALARDAAERRGETYRPIPEDFAWVTDDGRLIENRHIIVTGERREQLTQTMNAVIHKAKELFREAIDNEETGKRGLGYAFPIWFKEEGHNVERLGGIRRTFVTWRTKLMLDAEAAAPGGAEEVRLANKELRKLAHEVYEATWKSRYEEDYWGRVIEAASAFAIEHLGLSSDEAYLYSILSFTVERHDHLNKWAGNMEESARRRRKDEYGKFAVHLLEGVAVLNINKQSMKTRKMSETQYSASVSEFLQCILSCAERQDIVVKIKKVSVAKKPTPLAKLRGRKARKAAEKTKDTAA